MIRYVERSFLCPDIRSQSDAEIIKETLASAPEIDGCEVDVAARRVVLRYAEEMNTESILYHLSDAGFPADVA